MIRLRRLAVLSVSTLLLAAPAAPALAQSAGDDQYSDPLGTSSKPKPKPKPAQTSTPAAPASPATPAPSAPVVPTTPGTAAPTAPTATAPATSAAAAAGTSGGLARTGSDVWKVALAGLVLVVTGIGLRLRTADDRA